ncbi:MAG: ABC transporter permease [Clostridia bacterium]|nr:ABC transporter permease [Clostridia bacterium]
MAEYNSIPKEKFQFANREVTRDKALVTKSKSFWQDAFSRFCKNKGAVVGAIVVVILMLFAAFGPLFTPYTPSYSDLNYKAALPKLFNDVDFWDGCKNNSANKETFVMYYSMGMESGHNAVKRQEYTVDTSNGSTLYYYREDSYHKVGYMYRNVNAETYKALQDYQDSTGRQVLYPVIAYRDREDTTKIAPQDHDNANYWFVTKVSQGKTVAVLKDSNDPSSITPNYSSHEKGSAIEQSLNYNSSRIAGDEFVKDGKTYCYDYARVISDQYEVRVNYYEYYTFVHACQNKDGIKEPSFIFGATAEGKDIYACLSNGARFSFIFAILVAVVNIFVGAIFGAIEGYYGGKLDLILERIVEILSAVPIMIVITLMKEYLHSSGFIVLFMAYFVTGWIGMAGTTRMQFYRFKNQEYVLAARTLGAKDKRLMWKHIFPNAIGTLVTSCALIIPSMIFAEVSMTYLGIINLEGGNLTSVGTLISAGQACLMSAPFVAMIPSVFLGLLMLSFNLFGNGLRDAFNPSLRGSEG